MKCDKGLIKELLLEDGIILAYHMNKNSWVSILIDEVSDDRIKVLIDISFDLTR